eukprot:TRINITY_DN2800_c0_g1_i1.p1 TRINITY_DN2800_c0_g1~~TRINITY_DN2800_c0_g1_i1.p1  ORF type:complete len:154 (+),score=5.90 TRINITY_DN2800_c0_g1_i1:47-508(+)
MVIATVMLKCNNESQVFVVDDSLGLTLITLKNYIMHVFPDVFPDNAAFDNYHILHEDEYRIQTILLDEENVAVVLQENIHSGLLKFVLVETKEIERIKRSHFQFKNLTDPLAMIGIIQRNSLTNSHPSVIPMLSCFYSTTSPDLWALADNFSC